MFYKYDAKTKFYIGEVEGQINPVNPKEVLQPANTTTIKPPSIKSGDIAIFKWDRWIIEGETEAVLNAETPEDKINKVDDMTNIRNSMLDDTDKYMLSDFPIPEEKRNK